MTTGGEPARGRGRAGRREEWYHERGRRAAIERIKAAKAEILRSLRAIRGGRPEDAEPDRARRANVESRRDGAEAIQGDTVDFVDAAFFERGRRASRAVCRIITKDGQGLGTGFLISPQLLMTNNHVIGSHQEAEGLLAEFDYERGLDGRQLPVTRFELNAGVLVTDDRDDLDYTVIAVGARVDGKGELEQYGCLPISSARDKHQLGDHVNIIQHPDGRLKEAVVRENQLVARPNPGTVLYYVADTEPGSSGSPVMNERFCVVALHHWGGPHRGLLDDGGHKAPTNVNEGIRASAIFADLTTKKSHLDPEARRAVDAALTLGLESGGVPQTGVGVATVDGVRGEIPATRAPGGFTAQMGTDGSVTWHLPLSVTVRLGDSPSVASVARAGAAGLPASTQRDAAERALEVDRNYRNRRGYDEKFLGGDAIPLPQLSRAQRGLAAKNKQPSQGQKNAYELRYQHFSVVMNGKRRLAFFTATNIDGTRPRSVDRGTGRLDAPENYRADESEGAEGGEAWYTDPRIEAEQQTPVDLYSGQTARDASGRKITDRRSGDHRNRIFQQGHLTRRQDPLWGDDDAAVLRAHEDTFHVTNRAPQVGYFNMGTRKPAAEARHPGGSLHWRALEDYVLKNAIADEQRVTVFTGPVFTDGDMPWTRGRDDMEGFKAPRKFWKVVLRRDRGVLSATALLADQTPLIDYIPEMLESTGAEADRIAFEKVAKYQVSIRKLEKLTGLSFGEDVVAADTSGGGEVREVESVDDVRLARKGSRARVGAKRGARKAKPGSRQRAE